MTSNPSSRIDGSQAGWGRFAEILCGVSSRPPLPSDSKTGRLWNVALARGALLKAVNSKEQELLAARRLSTGPKTKKGEKLIRITPRHCVVCLRDDRAGEHRKSGFKCMECIGKPTPHNVVVVHDEEHSVRKGVRDGGEVVFGSYEMVHLLGSGAFGKVMLCYHLVSGQAYAAKVIDKARLIKKSKIRFRGGSTQDSIDGGANRSKKEEVDLAKKEVQIMSELNHPNIIKMIGSMDSEDHLFILMEYLPNGQIYKLNDDPTIGAKPIRTPLLKCYTVGIARGLKYLHGKGICHRDIKPENILLDGHNNVKLADFGVSAQTDCNSESFNVTGFAGTPAYMPPEAFEKNSNEGNNSDCWSFGVTLYCMGFGKQPFVCDNLYQYSHAIRESELTFDHEDPQFNLLLAEMINRNHYLRISMDSMCFIVCTDEVGEETIQIKSRYLLWSCYLFPCAPVILAAINKI